MLFEVNIVQWGAFDLTPSARCMDKLSLADVNPYMNDPFSSGYGKKNQVCRFNVSTGDWCAVFELGFGCSWHMNPDFFVGIYHQPWAVKTFWGKATPAIGCTHGSYSRLDNCLTRFVDKGCPGDFGFGIWLWFRPGAGSFINRLIILPGKVRLIPRVVRGRYFRRTTAKAYQHSQKKGSKGSV